MHVCIFLHTYIYRQSSRQTGVVDTPWITNEIEATSGADDDVRHSQNRVLPEIDREEKGSVTS